MDRRLIKHGPTRALWMFKKIYLSTLFELTLPIVKRRYIVCTSIEFNNKIDLTFYK